MREDKFPVRIWWVLSQRGRIFDVVQRQRSQRRNNDVVVGEVGVDLLVEREGLVIVIVGAVDGGVGGRDVLVLQAGKQFLSVADALGAAGRIAVGIVIVVFDIEGVFEASPFVFSEERAEIGAA
jgi:hypothetical protein